MADDNISLLEPGAIGGGFVPQPRPDLAVAEFDGEVVLYDRRARQAHHLNATASVIWQCFDGEGNLDELIADLSEAYNLAPDVIGPDVTGLAQDMGRAGLLVGVRGGEEAADLDADRELEAEEERYLVEPPSS